MLLPWQWLPMQSIVLHNFAIAPIPPPRGGSGAALAVTEREVGHETMGSQRRPIYRRSERGIEHLSIANRFLGPGR